MYSNYTSSYRPSYRQNDYNNNILKQDQENDNSNKNKNKYCQEHDKEELKVVCFLNDCSHKSRLLCIKCMMGPHHEHYDHFTLIEEIINNAKTDPLKVKNWPKISKSEELKEFFTGVKQDIKTFNDFESNVDKFIENVQQSLQKVKERTIQKMQTRKEKALESEQLIKQSLNKNYPLTEASTFLQEFQEGKFEESELETKITAFLKPEKYEKAEKEVLELFDSEQEKLSKVPQVLQHPDLVKDRMEQILILINSLYSGNLQFYKCVNYKPELDLSDSVDIQNNYIHFKGSPMTSTYMFSDGFTKDQNIILQFKVYENDNRNHLFLGIGKREEAEQGNLFSGGNYFDIQNPEQNSVKESKVTGDWIHNYLEKVIEVEIQIQDSKFIIRDLNKNNIVENKFKLDLSKENPEEEWCVIFGTSFLHSFKINILQFTKLEK